MGKETEITIKYGGLRTAQEISELLAKADETDLRVMTALFMLAEQRSAATPASLAELLEMDKGEVNGSLKFWRGAGLIEDAKGTKKTPKQESARPSEDKTAAIKTAHRDGAIEKSSQLEQYSSAELADIMERRVVSAGFIDEAERIMGKMFRTYDTSILVGIVDRLGFEEEAVLMILNYVVNGKGKKSMRYAETVAMALYDEGITDTAQVIERIDRMERATEEISKIRSLYGIGDRALTTTEKRCFTAWTETFAYDIDVIRMAYDITVDTTQKPVPRYTNGILERWYADGVRTAEDARKYLERQSGDTSRVTKSYDTDEFFEAALQRSYEDMN